MAQAIWNNQVIAESNDIEVVEGNKYFPMESINKSFFKDSNTHSTCPWKGEASYFSVIVDGKENTDSAWYYPNAKDAAKNIENRVAFWKGVEIVD